MQSQRNSPNATIQPILPATPESHIHSFQSIGSDGARGNRMSFYQVAQKIIEEGNNRQKEEAEVEEEKESEEEETNQEYFSPDPERAPEDDDALTEKLRDEKDSNAYDTYFKPGIFFKFAIMHALYFFLLGPLIIIIAPIVGMPALYNQGFIPTRRFGTWNQLFQYLIIVSFLVVFYTTNTKGLQAMEVYMIALTGVVRIITISSKYAYRSNYFNKIFFSRRMTPEELESDQMLSAWRIQTDKIIEEEVQAALLRLEVDRSLFFFNFLGRKDPEMLKKLCKKIEPGKPSEIVVDKKDMDETKKWNISAVQTPKELALGDIHIHHDDSIKRNDPRGDVPTMIEEDHFHVPSHRSIIESKYKDKLNKARAKIPDGQKSKSNSLQAPTLTPSQAIYQSFSSFIDAKQFEESHLYGYNLAVEMLKEARNVRYQHLGKSIVLISLVRAFIPTFYRMYLAYYKNEDIPIWTDKPYIAGSIIFVNALLFWANCFILAVAVLDLNSRTFCLKQIGYLVSPKKLTHYRDRKLYPTVNIFDPITLRTWSNLRRLFIEYGRKYVYRNNFNVTVTMTIYLFVLTILVLQVIGWVHTYDDPLLLIVFTYESAVFFGVFISIMVGGAFINNQFGADKNLLKKNKMIVSDFYRLSNVYVGKDAIVPENYVYKEGLRIMKKELGTNNFEEKLIDRSEKLVSIIDDIIEELDFEENNEPYTVLGIPVNYGMLKTAAAGLVSVGFALGQSLIGD